MVSLMALGGFREDTLTKLVYRHVRSDLEARRTPIRVHVETTITKGRYGDYDTFLGAEAVEFLKLYLDSRRHGSPYNKIPPEEINDDSPLILDSRSRIPRPIGPKQVRKIVHHLFLRAGLIKKSNNGRQMYELRTHSLRKFFKTQMEAAGVNSDYVEYMMGHVVDTYHDVQGLGVEKLRRASHQ
jgi:site-specific recombinase XerD